MRSQQDHVRAIVRREGVVARSDHPDLIGSLERMTRTGELASVLPGVYGAAENRGRRDVRLAALARWAPDAVLVEHTAAQLTFWPAAPGAVVACALPWQRDHQPGFAFSRRRVPPELVVERSGLRMTCPALTALDLCEHHQGDGIDHALRTRTATLDALHEALRLTRGRPGNTDRRVLLLDSRDEPWSAAERVCHRLLRGAGITGWKSNLPVVLQGQRYFLDVGFVQLRLGLEIDGRLHHDDAEAFENDRWRQNALVLAGWTVLRFTWRMLRDQPERVVEVVREVIRGIRSAR